MPDNLIKISQTKSVIFIVQLMIEVCHVYEMTNLQTVMGPLKIGL